MKKISLTRGKFALVDDIDFEFLSQWKWYLNHGYAVCSSRKSDGLNRRGIFIHRVVLIRKLGHSNFQHTDHRNQNKLDNRRDNLRPASNSQNQGNRKKRKGSSRFKGVCWHKRDKKWVAQIKFESRQKYLGYFTDEIEAAKVYNRAATKYFSEFACLNKL